MSVTGEDTGVLAFMGLRSPSLPDLSQESSLDGNETSAEQGSSVITSQGQSMNMPVSIKASLERSSSCPDSLSVVNKKQSGDTDCHGFQIKPYYGDESQRKYLWDAKTSEKLRKCINNIYHRGKRDDPVFFIIANLQYRLGSATPNCPICLKIKGKQPNQQKKSTTHPQSHIFPECLLKTYLAIHFPEDREKSDVKKGDKNKPIFDAFSKEFKMVHKLTYPLFCYQCEVKASKKEKFLKVAYLQIMEEETGLSIDRVQLADLKYMLALLLFRGILYSINFIKLVNEDYFDKFMDAVLELRRFCACEENSSWIPDRMCIFLLPNGPINPFVPTFILEFQFRNPLYTTIVAKDSTNGVYLYTKFDCFHCVLPLDDNSIRYFDTFNRFKRGKETYDLPYGRAAIQELFPCALLQHGMDSIGELVKILTGLNSPAKIIINGLESGTKILKIPSAPTQNLESKEISIELSSEKSLLKSASEKSPLALNNSSFLRQQLEQERKKKKKIVEENMKLKGEILTLKEMLEASKASNTLGFSDKVPENPLSSFGIQSDVLMSPVDNITPAADQTEEGNPEVRASDQPLTSHSVVEKSGTLVSAYQECAKENQPPLANNVEIQMSTTGPIEQDNKPQIVTGHTSSHKATQSLLRQTSDDVNNVASTISTNAVVSSQEQAMKKQPQLLLHLPIQMTLMTILHLN